MYSVWKKTLTIRQNIFRQIFEKSPSVKISRYAVCSAVFFVVMAHMHYIIIKTIKYTSEQILNFLTSSLPLQCKAIKFNHLIILHDRSTNR